MGAEEINAVKKGLEVKETESKNGKEGEEQQDGGTEVEVEKGTGPRGVSAEPGRRKKGGNRRENSRGGARKWKRRRNQAK